MKKEPKIGQKIYVPTELYIDRGEDDFAGGLATINKIEYSDHLPRDHYNYTMVSIEENTKERCKTLYNWNYIIENQKKWSKEYKGKITHPDPDYNTY